MASTEPVEFHGVKLPTGWIVKQWGSHRDEAFVICGSGRIGAVTVAFKSRGFRPGFSTTGPLAAGAGTYKGRNWRTILVETAVRYLEESLT